MAIRKGNKTVPITLTPYHQEKLKVIGLRSGLTNTAVVQRMIEQYELFESETVQIQKALDGK